MYDLAAVKAAFEDECRDPSVLEETCEQINVDGMRGDGSYLTVPLAFPKRDRGRAQDVCEQIASSQDDLAGEPLGYEIVIIEGCNNKRLAECNVWAEPGRLVSPRQGTAPVARLRCWDAELSAR